MGPDWRDVSCGLGVRIPPTAIEPGDVMGEPAILDAAIGPGRVADAILIAVECLSRLSHMIRLGIGRVIFAQDRLGPFMRVIYS
jgi:hypothetical protein